MSATQWVAFAAAAAIGAPARYLLDIWVQRRIGHQFPWGTFVVNVTGSFVLGMITGLGLYHGLGDGFRTILGTGGLGAYTTFSSVTFETVRLVEEGAVDKALLNAVGTFAVCLAAAAGGLAVASAIP